MTQIEQQLLELKQELNSLKNERQATQAGLAVAMVAISSALREIPGYKPKIMEGILTHSLKHGWPLVGIPDNEATETAYSTPLRFLLNEHLDARDSIRRHLDQTD